MSEFLQDPVGCYRCYCGIKAHFKYNSTYDYVKMNGKINVTKNSFDRRKDKLFFYYISKQYDEREIVPFFVSQFVENSTSYISDFVFEKQIAEENYKSFLIRHQNILDNFKLDINTLIQIGKSWKQILVSKTTPIIFQLLIKRKIAPETYTILDDIFSFIQRIDKTNEFLLEANWKFLKYKAFLGFSVQDIVKFAKILPKKI